MGGSKQVVVRAVVSNSDIGLLPDEDKVYEYKYREGDLGVLTWIWEGFEYMPDVLVRWDKSPASARKVWLSDIEPVGIEEEGCRVMIGFGAHH